MDKHSKHRNILYAIVIFLLIFQIISFVFTSIQFSKLDSKLSSEVKRVETSLSSHFTDLINGYDEENQRNFNELSIAITKQNAEQQSFQHEINLLKTTQDDFSGVIKESVKSVVAVMTESSVGSGFIVRPDGYIITNYHVIQEGTNIRILTYENSPVSATVEGTDKLRDLALLKIDGKDLNYLSLADSDNLEVGNKVIAIGNPLGLSFTVTQGIISALNREGPNGLQEYIQTDVSLNPGNSGGPLLNTDGKVIGINNFKIGGAESLGFALESNSIKSSINALFGKEII